MGRARTLGEMQFVRPVRVLVATVLAVGLLSMTTTVGASDVDLGSPTTIEELLASPEYLPEHADIARLYQAFFNRQPDVGGLVYWIDVYEDGADLIDLSWGFSNSTEFRSLYGAELSNGEFLEVVYTNVLGRAYDQEGFDYWLGVMNDGLSRHETVFWIVAGEEFKTAHPFTGTYPAVETALLIQSEVPTSYTDASEGRSDTTAAEIANWEVCDQWRSVHSNVYSVFFGQADGAQFVLQEMYAFSELEDAQAVVNEMSSLAASCASRTFALDDGARLTINYYEHSDPSFVSDVGDQAAVIRAEWVWAGGPTYSYYLWIVRDGNVITVTDLTVRDGTPNYSIGRSYATDTSVRVRELLGLD